MSNRQRKKERRAARKARNIAKEKVYKEEAWKRGKLIYENHNNKEFSQTYTQELAQRLVDILKRGRLGAEGDNNRFLEYFRMFRIKIRDLIILWNPLEPETENYKFLKSAIEIYWDDKENFLQRVLQL